MTSEPTKRGSTRSGGPTLLPPGLTPLPWFAFPVAASAATTRAGARIAHRAELAWTFLCRTFRCDANLALLVLDRADWPRYAQAGGYAVRHIAQGRLIAGAETDPAWSELSRYLADALPASVLAELVAVHGPDAVTHGPALTAVSEAFLAREIAHFVFAEMGCAFPQRWSAEAFACYAAVAVIGETDPRGLRLLGSLADATATLDYDPCDRAARRAPRGLSDSVGTVLSHLQLARAAYFAYAHAHVEPLRRVFELARRAALPHNDRDLRVLLTQRVHPSLRAIVHAACPVHDARAAA